MRALLLAVVLLAALPLAAGQDARPTANLLVYHAHPDPRAGAADADPFSTPAAPGPATGRLPLTRFDGVEDASDAPEGDPASVPAHFREMQRLLRAHERAGAPLVLVVDGRVEADALVVEARGDPVDARVAFELRATVYEDGLDHEGASGVRHHRFVARADLAPAAAANATWRVPIDPAWDLARLGVVVSARAPESGEALQSARWTPRQEGPTVQSAKAVLVEHVTATWCVPCGPSDEALHLLAAQWGDRDASAGGASYARALTPPAIGGAALGLVGAWWLGRRWSA